MTTEHLATSSIEHRRRLLALNHFANPANEPGGTRMVELAGHLDDWDTLILAADRNLFTRARRSVRTASFRTVPTLPYQGNGYARMLNWASYALSAVLAGARTPRPDVVLGSSPHLLAPLAAWLLALRFRAAFVVEVRDLWPQVLADTGRLATTSRTFRLLSRLERFLYARADAVVVLTEGVAEDLRRSGVAADKLHVVPNGASPEDWVPTRPREVTRHELKWDGFVALYAGAHGPANGLDALLDAAATLRATHPAVHIVLVGDGVEKAALRERADREHLDNVEFLDPVPKDQMADLLHAADIGLHVLADVPLFAYGVSPNKLYDYMAAGLPVVTNTEGEVAAIVEASAAGVAVGTRELATGIASLDARGPAARAALGGTGQEWLRRNASRSTLARRLHDALDAAVTASRARGTTA